jgi:hypothetical protein
MSTLSDLNLDRYLKKALQTMSTLDSVLESSGAYDNVLEAIPSGGAAQDINTSNVTINGSQLTPGTIPQTTLDVSNWGWGQTCAFSSASNVQVNWGAGVFTSAGGETYNISAGNTGTMSAKTYIYLDLNVSDTTYQHTTTPATSVGIGKVLIAVAQNSTSPILATYMLSEATQIVGDNILANTISASKITTGQLIVGTNVGLGTAQDSSGVTTIIGNTVTTGFINALSVVAGSVAAENITGTYITGKTVRTASSGFRIQLNGSNNHLEFLNDSTVYGSVYTYVGLASTNGLTMETSNTGPSISVTEGTNQYIELLCGDVTMTFDDNNNTIYQQGIFDADIVVIETKFKLPVGTNLY